MTLDARIGEENTAQVTRGAYVVYMLAIFWVGHTAV
jgi:hypothetical protein